MSKKVLSLDGGGSWAILQAMALKAIYRNTAVGTGCRNILNDFDVISANSGGSLMLASMIEHCDEDIDYVIEMFKNEYLRKEIFSRLKPFEKSFSEMIARLVKVGPKYRAARKIGGLLEALPDTGNIKMSEIRKVTNIHPHLVICGFDYDRNRAVFFKTQQRDKDYTLADAVNAASNAPVNYFDEPVRFTYDDGKMHQYWDGAVGGNNNPVLISITEALRIFPGIPHTCKDMLVLSIGTGNNLLPVKSFTASDSAQSGELLKPIEKPSLPKDIQKMGTSILSEPPEAANFMAHMFLGGLESTDAMPNPEACIIRMNALLQPELRNGQWAFPEGLSPENYNDFLFLIRLGMDAVTQNEVLTIEKLGEWWVKDKVVNQSIRYDSKTFRCLIGYDRFSFARSEWLSRCKYVKKNLQHDEFISK